MAPPALSTVDRAMHCLGLARLDRLGSGKTAAVFAAETPGGHRRVVRISTLDVESREVYADVSRASAAQHEYIQALMPTRVPRLYKRAVVPSKRGDRALAHAQVMEHIDAPSVVDATDAMRADLRVLLNQLWSNRLSHGDLHAGNLLYDRKAKRWKLIDFDMLRAHKSAAAAKRRDMRALPPDLKALLARQ